MDDEDDEEGEAPCDDNDSKESGNEDNDGEESDNEDNDSEESDSEDNDSQDNDSKDNSDDRGEATSDENRGGEGENGEAFNEENSYEGEDYYYEDIEDDEEVVRGDYDEYPYRRPLDWSYITDVSPKSGPRYDKYGHEISKLGSFHNSEFGLLTTYIDEEDDIDARLALLNKNLTIHSFRNLTIEGLKEDDE